MILVLGGMALAFVPGLPQVPLDPELALAFFLPPLLQASAFRMDWRGFRRNLRPILLLAVGCIAFTAACVAAVAKLLVPELPWAAAVALGAIVAPPDAVAAGAVLQRARLPRGVVTILEGESLINDATALVLYRFAVAAVAAGALSPWEGVSSFLLVAAGGVAVGWAAGRAAIWATMRLDDTMLETALGFLVCYASYLAAEALHLSGVIAVVTTGLVFGQTHWKAPSPPTSRPSSATAPATCTARPATPAPPPWSARRGGPCVWRPSTLAAPASSATTRTGTCTTKRCEAFPRDRPGRAARQVLGDGRARALRSAAA